MTIHSLRSRLSTMSCPLFIRFIIVCSINMNVHLQHSYMGIRGILFRSYKHQITAREPKHFIHIMCMGRDF